jgi:hypothetical protein
MLKPSINERRLTNVEEEKEEEGKEQEVWSSSNIESRQKNKMGSYYDAKRDRGNLGFMEAKEDFIRDRNMSMFGTPDGKPDSEDE